MWLLERLLLGCEIEGSRVSERGMVVGRLASRPRSAPPAVSLRSPASPSFREGDVCTVDDVGGFESRLYRWWGVPPLSFGHFPRKRGQTLSPVRPGASPAVGGGFETRLLTSCPLRGAKRRNMFLGGRIVVKGWNFRWIGF